ncbi:hypothetical protein [Egicoccus sp. AB-alg2]|uniref:hypothetical protein n=1 Tax=Egicoccus sp. AB-alg2 TaxID=3242693 RepID=UPI00359D934D
MRVTRRPRSLTAVLTAGTLAVSACTGGGSGDATGAAPADESTLEAAKEREPAGASGTIELAGVQQTHPSGATVAVNAITVDEAGDVYVEIEALVAGRRGAQLAGRTTILEDDLGNRYEFVQPDGNRTLDFARDTQATATLAFVGPLDVDATRVTLGLNGHFRDGARPTSDTPARTTTPTFAFEGLPLPGVGLDDEAAGPDDVVGLQIPSADVQVTDAAHEGPAQVTIEVTGIEVSPSLVIVTLEARNEGDREKNLIQRPPELRVEQDGQSLGNDHPFAFEGITTEDGDVDRLTLAPGEEATASFAFRGVVPARATGLRLGFQVLQSEVDRGAPRTEERAAGNPTVVFTGLPLPDDAAAISGGDEADTGADTGADSGVDTGVDPDTDDPDA